MYNLLPCRCLQFSILWCLSQFFIYSLFSSICLMCYRFCIWLGTFCFNFFFFPEFIVFVILLVPLVWIYYIRCKPIIDGIMGYRWNMNLNIQHMTKPCMQKLAKPRKLISSKKSFYEFTKIYTHEKNESTIHSMLYISAINYFYSSFLTLYIMPFCSILLFQTRTSYIAVSLRTSQNLVLFVHL